MTERSPERWIVKSGAVTHAVRIQRGADDTVLEVEIGSGDTARTVTATILSCSEDMCVVAVGGQSTVVRLAPHDRGCHAMAAGEPFIVTSAASDSADAAIVAGPGATSTGMDLDALCAPMPATVSAVLVRPGAVVREGDTLVRLEAMKMELAIRAPSTGRVATVDCTVGELVQPGRPLVTLEAPRRTASETSD